MQTSTHWTAGAPSVPRRLTAILLAATILTVVTANRPAAAMTPAAHADAATSPAADGSRTADGDGFEDESSVRLRTSDFVATALMSGPHYKLDPVATVSRSRLIFVLHTRWGDLQAVGRARLELRLQEMQAIERALSMNRDPQLIRSFLGTLDDSRQGAALILNDPLGTVFRVPRALGATVNDFVNTQNRRSGGDVRRRVAAELNCDPETSNPVLSALLDWIAARQGVGSIAGKAGLNLVLPGLALVPASAQFKEQLADRQPSEINADLERELTAAGCSPELSRHFVRLRAYTTLQRLQLMSLLRPLLTLPQRDLLLSRVVRVSDPADASLRIRECALLADVHDRSPIRALVDDLYLTAVDADGARTVVSAEDYRVWSRELAAFRQTWSATFGQGPAELSGTVILSPRAAEELAAGGIRLSLDRTTIGALSEINAASEGKAAAAKSSAVRR